MIFTNVSIVVKDGESKQDRSIYIYRGDRNVEVRFTIESPFRYTDVTNLIEDSDAYFAQLVIKKPGNNNEFIYSSITPTEYGVAKLMITGDMIDEIKEVGDYDYQLILYDEETRSRVTIPPIIGGIKILNPISLIEDETIVNRARVGLSFLPQVDEEVLETFDEEGRYNRTNWLDQDLITDGKLNKMEDALYGINEKTVFETDKLTVNSLGGIAAGTDLDGLSIKEILNQLLYPYVKPTISISTTPNGGIYERGNYQTITNIRVAIVKKTDSITSFRILDEEEVIYSKQDSIENGGTYYITCNILVTNNRGLTIEVMDSTGNLITTSSTKFNYVYPYYYGVADENTFFNDTFIKTLTKKIETKGEKTLTYTTNNQRMILAYPTAYGELSRILDENGFDVTSTFTSTIINLGALDGTTQTYYVYANNLSTIENFTMKFSY